MVAGCIAVFGLFLAPEKKVNDTAPAITGRSGEISASSELLNLRAASEFYRYEIEKHPDKVRNYIQLAQLYLQQARIMGRHHFFVTKAETLIDQALDRDPENFAAITTRALLKMQFHHFEEARELAQRAIAQNSFDALSWGLLSDALKELGDYDGAVKACDKMLRFRPDLRSYSRAAHLREIHGDLDGACQAMKLACEAGVSGLESRAWALYQLGQLYFKAGKLDTAGYIYQGILEERPDYPYAFSGLAQIRKSMKEYEAAIQLTLRAYEISPEHKFLEQLAELYGLSEQVGKAENLTQMVFAAFNQHEEQGWIVNLEYARFCAAQEIRLDEALRRIKIEYQRRPKNIDVVETYARILLKTSRASEANQIIKSALQGHANNARLNSVADLIAAKAAHFDQDNLLSAHRNLSTME
ncbi:MAG: tetratricopeptide repeat protein, partial [bacterium]